MNNYIIRKAQEDDVNVISKLLKQLGYETEPVVIKKMLTTATNPDNEVFVCTHNEKVIALMSLIIFNYFPSAQKLCRITSIVVNEKLRGSGVGTKLINHAKFIALNRNCSILEVTTSLKRQQTQKYYENIGFKKTSYKYILKLENNV
mgnify:CR=1 FL=1